MNALINSLGDKRRMMQSSTDKQSAMIGLIRRLRARSNVIDRAVIAFRPIRRKLSWVVLFWGSCVHLIRGQTPKSAHSALVTLFMDSGGRANDKLAAAVAALHPPYKLPTASGVLGELTDSNLARIEAQLERDGYMVFEDALSHEFCDRIIRKALEAECQLMGDEAVTQQVPQFRRYKDDRASPRATQYALTRDDTTDIEEVQELISDPSIIAVAQNYLKSKPIFSGIWLGWSTALKDRPDDNTAQEFHWDMERIRWLRFFLYITDVGPENGPHCFIKGTHRTGAIPMDLLELGYVRHRDGTIVQRFGHENYREFTGRRGTIIAEDSRGFHKGKMLTKGERLLMAFELSNTTFGVNKRHNIRNIRVARFGKFAKQYPRLYINFDFV